MGEQDIYFFMANLIQRSKLFCWTDTNRSFNMSLSMALAVSLMRAEHSALSFCISVCEKEAWGSILCDNKPWHTTEAHMRFRFVRRLEQRIDIVSFQVTVRNIGSRLLCILPTLIVRLIAEGIVCSSDQGVILSENGDHGHFEAGQRKHQDDTRGNWLCWPFPVPHSLKNTSSAANNGLALSVGMQYLDPEMINNWLVKIKCRTVRTR